MVRGVLALAVGVWLAIGAVGGPQVYGQQAGKSKAVPPTVDLAKPVTQKEVAATFEKLETAVQRVVLKGDRPPAKRPASQQPASRSEIVREMFRLYRMSEPKFRFTPKKQPFEKSDLSIAASDGARPMLEKLIEWGFVGRVAPLATSDKPTMQLPEFADAVSLFLARIAELTHTPSSNWSPYMNWHKDNP